MGTVDERHLPEETCGVLKVRVGVHHRDHLQPRPKLRLVISRRMQLPSLAPYGVNFVCVCEREREKEREREGERERVKESERARATEA